MSIFQVIVSLFLTTLSNMDVVKCGTTMESTLPKNNNGSNISLVQTNGTSSTSIQAYRSHSWILNLVQDLLSIFSSNGNFPHTLGRNDILVKDEKRQFVMDQTGTSYISGSMVLPIFIAFMVLMMSMQNNNYFGYGGGSVARGYVSNTDQHQRGSGLTYDLHHDHEPISVNGKGIFRPDIMAGAGSSFNIQKQRQYRMRKPMVVPPKNSFGTKPWTQQSSTTKEFGSPSSTSSAWIPGQIIDDTYYYTTYDITQPYSTRKVGKPYEVETSIEKPTTDPVIKTAN